MSFKVGTIVQLEVRNRAVSAGYRIHKKQTQLHSIIEEIEELPVVFPEVLGGTLKSGLLSFQMFEKSISV